MSTSNIKKNKPLDAAALRSGLAHIELVRGKTNWGAQWIYNSGGLQQDILQAAEVFRTLSTDGAYCTDAELAVLSGYIASGNMSISSHVALGVFSGFLGSGGTSLVPSWSEYGALSGYIASGSMDIAGYYTDAQLGAFSGYLGSGANSLVPSWTEYTALSGYYASGNICQDSTHAMPSGGFYINAGDDSTGVYQIYVNTAGSSSGNLMIIPV